uniref:Ig-like domain-containing protein n=1 Tax=Anguilla anguilla TaxID=7936 RepID=A0A0E9X4Y7_ANGAN
MTTTHTSSRIWKKREMLIFPSTRKCCILIVGIIAFATESVVTMAVVTATHGHDAALSCKLMHHKKVVQVTWKKITPNSSENVATYSRFGAIIAKPFQEQVRFLEAGLHKSSLLIKGIGDDYEACYSCIFYSYPKGVVSSTACLKVYELNELVTEVREMISRDDHILHALTCFDSRALNVLGHADNDDHVESSVGRIDPSSEFSVSVIKASLVDGRGMTCVVRPPPMAKRKDVSTIKGEPRVQFLHNRNRRLSPTLGFMIFVTGLGIYSAMSLIY